MTKVIPTHPIDVVIKYMTMIAFEKSESLRIMLVTEFIKELNSVVVDKPQN